MFSFSLLTIARMKGGWFKAIFNAPRRVNELTGKVTATEAIYAPDEDELIKRILSRFPTMKINKHGLFGY
jgi:hypothetical protein